MIRPLSATAGAVSLVLATALPAAAGSDRMQLQCRDGRTIERSNGSSWWGVDHEAVYTTEHLRIDGQHPYEKSYGTRSPTADPSICTGEHHGSTWTVTLVRSR